MVTFSSWDLAKAYYKECFGNNSVHLREFREEQTPTQSPLRKRQKTQNPPHKLLANAPVQPHFAPAVTPTKPLGSPSVNSDRYSPLVFPESPLPKPTHHGVQETATDPIAELAKEINNRYLKVRAAANASIRSGSQPPAQPPISSPHIVRPHVIVIDSSDEDETPITSTGNLRDNNPRRIIVVESSDEDVMPTPVATNFKGNKYPRATATAATPAPAATNLKGNKLTGAIATASSHPRSAAPPTAMNSSMQASTSSLFVKFNSNPPAKYTRSDHEDLYRYSSDTERQLDELLGENRAGRRKPGPSSAQVAKSPTTAIDSDDEVRLFNSDTERELNLLGGVQKFGPSPRGSYRL